MSLLPPQLEPKTVMSPDGVPLATYDLGDPEAPAVLAVHGFASSAYANWIATGWARELERAGYRMIALDQRGHGRSGKPHEPGAYSMDRLVDDVRTVLDTYLVDEVAYVGYSLGARVGWHAALDGAHVITKAVLGGIPDGVPLTRFRVDQARAYVEDGTPVEDRITRAYLTMSEGIGGNDLAALVALVEGMQGGAQPDPANPPGQPVLFATGSEDGIVDRSRRLAEATPNGDFFEIPGRNHFNAPTARTFRDRAIEFLGSAVAARPERPKAPAQAAPPPAARAVDGTDVRWERGALDYRVVVGRGAGARHLDLDHADFPAAAALGSREAGPSGVYSVALRSADLTGPGLLWLARDLPGA